MPKTVSLSEREQRAYDALPAQGEITHLAWKQAVAANGSLADMKALHSIRRTGRVNFRLDYGANGAKVLFVSRNAAGMGGSTISHSGGN